MNIQTFKSELGGMLHGTSISHVNNINRVIERAGRNVLSRINPATTRRIANLSQAIHDDVFRYAAPSDLKGNHVIDIRPQVNRNEADSFVQVLGREFGKYKGNVDDIFSIRHDDGTKFLKLSKNVDIEAAVQLHQMDSTSDNGTWSVGGNATNLTEDSQFYISGAKSLNFDLSSGSDGDTGHIQVSDMSADDLSEHEDVGSIFLWLYLPDASIINGATDGKVNLRWGSSTSAYWDRDVTQQHNGNTFRNGWNLLRFDWDGASETGSPDSENVDFIRITLTYDGTAETDIRVDDIFASVGEIFEIEYYSHALYRSTSGSFSTTINDDTDVINLDENAVNIHLYEALKEAASQQQGEETQADLQKAMMELHGDGTNSLGLYSEYKKNHPSEVIKQQSTYYRMRGVNFGLGR